MLELIFMVCMTGQLDPTVLPGYLPEQRGGVAVAQVDVEPIQAERVPDTSDWVAWAAQDLLLMPAHDKPFTRYLVVPPWGDVSWHQVNSFAVNSAVSSASVIVLPDSAAGGWLIRWDLRRLAPRPADLARLLALWDALAISEPYFHATLPHGKTIPCREYIHLDGKTYRGRYHIPASEGYAILESETGSFAPLLRADYFLRRVMSTVEGGLYYHFIGMIRDGKRLTETEIFRSVGLSVGLSREVQGDDRAAVFQSAITGKSRTVEQIQGAIGKGRVTYDIFDEDSNAERHPIYNLLGFVERARGKEIIFERANGLLGYFLTDGRGNLVDVAPPNIASDHRTPEPLTRQLFPPLSCVRCHGPNQGVQRVRNDVPTLLAGGTQGEVDLFADLAGGDRIETIDRIAGLYAASDKFDGDLALSRVRYADAVWSATRGMGVKGREQVAVKVAEQTSKQYADYWYPRSPTDGNVNADRACLESGYRVKDGQGAAFLRQLVKPGRVDVVIDGVAIEFADPSLAALRQGLSIRRQDWERVAIYAGHLINKARKEPSK